MTPTSEVLLVSIVSQKMFWLKSGSIVKTYQVSTSHKTPSCHQDSNGTPWGLHQIRDKIGHDEPLGMVFRGRVPLNKHYSEMPKEDQQDNLITTRILRLQGLETGLNSGDGIDSYQRYIYIHGTNHEDRIGMPASGGCVLMKNKDVLELFEGIEEGIHVWIDHSN